MLRQRGCHEVGPLGGQGRVHWGSRPWIRCSDMEEGVHAVNPGAAGVLSCDLGHHSKQRKPGPGRSCHKHTRAGPGPGSFSCWSSNPPSGCGSLGSSLSLSVP